MGILDKIEDKLSSNKHSNNNNNQVVDPAQPHGTHTGQGSHLQHGTSNVTGGPTTGSGIGGTQTGPGGVGGTHSGPGVGSGITGGSAVGGNRAGGPQNVVPGSHPAANNPSAIPTVGGHQVGSGVGGGNAYDSTYDNRTFGEKAKDKLNPSRADRPDDPVTGTNINQSTPATHGSGITGTGHSANTPLANDSGFNQRHGTGVTGSGPGRDTYGSGNVHDNRTFGEKAKDKLSNDRVDRPDDPITGQNYTQGGGNYGPGSTGGFAGSHQNAGQSNFGPGTTGSNIHDNRTFGEKAKDKMSSDRVDRPDDPITGQNYTQSGGNYGPGRTGGVTGNNHSSGPIGSSTYNSGTAPGVADNRSTMEKIKDKVNPNKNDRPDDPITGQNFGQTGGPNTTHTAGPGGAGAQRNW